jgi:hypothetical protein
MMGAEQIAHALNNARRESNGWRYRYGRVLAGARTCGGYQIGRRPAQGGA